MAKVVDVPCRVEAEEGEVILECGSQAVSLSPDVAGQAGDDLRRQVPAAKAHLATNATAVSALKD